MEKEIHYTVSSTEDKKRTIMVYGIDDKYPEMGKMLTIKEEYDEDGKIWITTSDYEKSVSLELGVPPRGILARLLTPITEEEHKENIIDLSINKWIEENG